MNAAEKEKVLASLSTISGVTGIIRAYHDDTPNPLYPKLHWNAHTAHRLANFIEEAMIEIHTIIMKEHPSEPSN
jgi:hypothetical protein